MQNLPTAIFIKISLANLATGYEFSLANPQKDWTIATWLTIDRAQIKCITT